MFRPIVKRVSTSRLLASAVKNTKVEIKTLEDLAKLNTLDDVDPKLISKLINEKTNELNIQNELQMLKQLQQAEQKSQETSLKKFVTPAWMFLLYGSMVYLGLHYVWWRLDYDEKEAEYQQRVKALETELAALNEAQSSNTSGNQNGSATTSKKWYRFW